jgi:hypothetical protein
MEVPTFDRLIEEIRDKSYTSPTEASLALVPFLGTVVIPTYAIVDLGGEPPDCDIKPIANLVSFQEGAETRWKWQIV